MPHTFTNYDMKPGMDYPNPAWVAQALRPAGDDLALSMLGVGMLGYDADEPAKINAFYTEIAECSDPVIEIMSLLQAVNDQQSPWLIETMQPLLGWSRFTTTHTDTLIRRCARVLAKIDFEFFRNLTGMDPLGVIYSELQGIDRRLEMPVYYCDTDTIAMNDSLRECPLYPGANFLDTACATGARAVVAAVFAMARGVSPPEVNWYLVDYDDYVLALAALSMAAIDSGPNTHFAVAQFPAWPGEIWPDVGFTHWITDIAETHARIHNGRRTAAVREFSNSMLKINPAAGRIIQYAHGVFPEDVPDEDITDEAIELAIATVTSSTFITDYEEVGTEKLGMVVLEHPLSGNLLIQH